MEMNLILFSNLSLWRRYPLTEDCPKCLLPVANRKLLSYQLDMLNKSGTLGKELYPLLYTDHAIHSYYCLLFMSEIYIVAPKEFELPLSNFLKDYRSSLSINVNIDPVFVEDMMGSADGLRAVSDRIRGDFICVSSDFISQFSLGDLAHVHRVNTSVSDIVVLCHSFYIEITYFFHYRI